MKELHSFNEYLNEKLVISKNYKDGYNYHPTTRKELEAALQEHYKNNIYDLNDIDVSEITNFSSIFMDEDAPNNFDISEWNVSNGKDFSWMFGGCEKFNCDLSNWDVSKGVDFRYMFYHCNEFNCDLNNWNVNKSRHFNHMFFGCENFNSDLSKWNVSRCKDFVEMFARCTNYNSDLSNWNIKDNSYTDGMFNECDIDDKFKPNGVQ